MRCHRCHSLDSEEIVARVRSEIIDLLVCSRCAEEARILGLVVEPHANTALSPAKKRQAA